MFRINNIVFNKIRKMKKIKVAVVSYGNIGKSVIEAVESAPDMELVGLVRRNASLNEKEAKELQDIAVVDDIKKLGEVHVAILCSPTRAIPAMAKEILALGIHTVDSYDIHSDIWELRQELMPVTQANKAVSVISAGWDPGSDSVVRGLLEAIAPKGITYTNFGPGMSMGHSVAVKTVKGVKDALSMTIPMGTSVHRRMVYVELEDGANFKEVEQNIKNDAYFINDETHVKQVDSVDNLKDMGHGVNLVRKGVSGKTQNQLFEFNMRINNPALTAQILVACARAATRLQPGAYTMIEIPVIDLLYGEKEDLIHRLV